MQQISISTSAGSSLYKTSAFTL